MAGRCRITNMVKRQKNGWWISARPRSAARSAAVAQAWGDAMRNRPGRPQVIAVSTKPGLTSVTVASHANNRARKPSA